MTEAVFRGLHTQGCPAAILGIARRDLRQIHAAGALTDLAVPPGNRLHPLVRDRAGRHPIRIDDQDRVRFRWTQTGPADVEIIDCHRAVARGMPSMRAEIECESDVVLPPPHPGEILRDEFLIPLALSAGIVARACGVPRTRIERIAAERTGISTDTAMRLARSFGTTPDLWLDRRRQFEIDTLTRTVGPEIERIRPLPREAA